MFGNLTVQDYRDGKQYANTADLKLVAERPSMH